MYKTIYFSSLAINQSIFWSLISKKLNDYNVFTLAFDSESASKKINNFLDVSYNEKKYNFNELKKYLRKYNLIKIKKIINHEILYFGKRDNIKLLQKLIFYLKKIESIVVETKNIIVIQELGGFLPNLALFYFCKKNKIKHIFIEPSFFKGRFHITEDAFQSFDTSKKYSHISDIELKKIINEAIVKKEIVIPQKDIKHFFNPIKKFINFRNLLRFIYKFYTSSFLRYDYVFNQNISVFFIYLKEILNYFFNKSLYISYLPKNFIYYPLHVPNDVALTLRAPECQNQFQTISLICALHNKEIICIKEHPARIGFLDLRLISNIKNLRIINPSVNNYDILKKTKTIYTVNSKAGFEAILLNKNVISLSDSFYCSQKMSHGPFKLNNLSDKEKILNLKDLCLSEKKKIQFFRLIFNASLQGELYYNSENNIKNFSRSINLIMTYISK